MWREIMQNVAHTSGADRSTGIGQVDTVVVDAGDIHPCWLWRRGGEIRRGQWSNTEHIKQWVLDRVKK